MNESYSSPPSTAITAVVITTTTTTDNNAATCSVSTLSPSTVNGITLDIHSLALSRGSYRCVCVCLIIAARLPSKSGHCMGVRACVAHLLVGAAVAPVPLFASSLTAHNLATNPVSCTRVVTPAPTMRQ